MIAYYGQMRVRGAARPGPFDRLIAAHFASPLYGRDWMVATGQGKLILGDRGHDINSYDLDDGNLTVRASSLLGFEPTMELKESIVPGFLTLLGTGKFLASSNGPVHFVEPPVRVDPDALRRLGRLPDALPPLRPRVHARRARDGARDDGHRRPVGEEHQFDFRGAGTVLMQSSEP